MKLRFEFRIALVTLLALAAPALAQDTNVPGVPRGGGLSPTTYANLPATPVTNQVYYVTDCNGEDDCSSGGGSAREIVYWNGATWVVMTETTAAPGGGDPILIGGSAIGDAAGVNFIEGTAIDLVLDTGVSPDTATVNWDSTEVGTTTFGSGAGIVWTFNAGATDPTLTFGSDSLAIANAATFTVDGVSFQPADADLDDLADGSLTASKIANGLTDAQVNNDLTLASATIATSTITLEIGADPTVDGRIVWNTTTVRIQVGDDGVGTQDFYPGAHTTDTNANTICAGTSVYLDGEGNCDDLSAAYQPLDADLTDLADGTLTASKVGNGLTDAQVEDTLTHTGGSIALESLTITAIADDEMLMGSGAGTAAFIAAPAGGTNGCSGAGEAAQYNSATNSWGCLTGLGAGGTVDSIQGDDDVATTGATLSIDGGTGGIDTDVVGDVMTVTFDSTEVAAKTWGSGSGFTWTFDVGVTDPTIAFASDAITFGDAGTIDFGAADLINVASVTIAASAQPGHDYDDSDDTGSVDAAVDVNCPTANDCNYGIGVDSGSDTLDYHFQLITADNGTTTTYIGASATFGNAPTNGIAITEGGVMTVVGSGSIAATDFAAATDLDSAGAVIANAVALGTDTTGNYAAGTAEAGAALTGDSATAFFSAGTLEHERGGLEADVSAYNGLIRIAAGSTTNVTNLAGLNTAIGANISDGAHTTDTNANTICTGTDVYLDGEGNCDTISGGGAPTDVDYLVGTANAGLSAEIVVGTSPGGELGGTWAAPTLDDGITVASWVLTDANVTLTASTAPTPTTDGNCQWENDDDHFICGDGVDQVEFVPTEDFSGDIAVTIAGAVTIQANAVALGTDTTGNYAAGDAEAGAALTGDTATAFFSAGQIEAARGGTGDDTSGATGVPRITAGNWTYDAGISHLGSSTTGQLMGVLSDEGSAATVLHGDGTWALIGESLLAAEDYGDFTCGAGADDCLLDANSVDSPEIAADAVDAAHISTLVRSLSWGAGGLSADGTQCADPAEVTVGSWGKMWTAICADNDASTLTGTTVMPDGWNAGTITIEIAVIQDAADTNALQGDVAARCVGDTETPLAYGTEVAVDDTMTGSDAINFVTSAAVTPAGTCAAGDLLQFQYQVDATGTTTGMTTLHFVNAKVEFVWNPED